MIGLNIPSHVAIFVRFEGFLTGTTFCGGSGLTIHFHNQCCLMRRELSDSRGLVFYLLEALTLGKHFCSPEYEAN